MIKMLASSALVKVFFLACRRLPSHCVLNGGESKQALVFLPLVIEKLIL